MYAVFSRYQCDRFKKIILDLKQSCSLVCTSVNFIANAMHTLSVWKPTCKIKYHKKLKAVIVVFDIVIPFLHPVIIYSENENLLCTCVCLYILWVC